MLASRLESDATLLRTVVVDRSTILLQNVGLVVTSFILAFMLNWRLTLVVISTYPLVISGHISEVCLNLSNAVPRAFILLLPFQFTSLSMNNALSENVHERVWWQLEQSIPQG